jgi:hypothetical protein
MQNAPLFHVLLDHLEAIETPPMEIQRFVDRWHRQRPHEAFPYLYAFSQAKTSHLPHCRLRATSSQ